MTDELLGEEPEIWVGQDVYYIPPYTQASNQPFAAKIARIVPNTSPVQLDLVVWAPYTTRECRLTNVPRQDPRIQTGCWVPLDPNFKLPQ